MTARAPIVLAFAMCVLAAAPASAALIENTFDGDLFGDSYSALFTVEDTGDPDLFLGTLTNTSPDDGIGPNPQISVLAFNTTAQFGVDFTIQNLSPAWTAVAGDAPGPPTTQFDVVLRSTTPGSRLARGESLTFEILALTSGSINLQTFLQAEIDTGARFGGPNDSGQKAVRFQRLAGGSRDLLADNWVRTAEPSSLILLGGGLLGIASLLRRRKRR